MYAQCSYHILREGQNIHFDEIPSTFRLNAVSKQTDKSFKGCNYKFFYRKLNSIHLPHFSPPPPLHPIMQFSLFLSAIQPSALLRFMFRQPSKCLFDESRPLVQMSNRQVCTVDMGGRKVLNLPEEMLANQGCQVLITEKCQNSVLKKEKLWISQYKLLQNF